MLQQFTQIAILNHTELSVYLPRRLKSAQLISDGDRGGENNLSRGQLAPLG